MGVFQLLLISDAFDGNLIIVGNLVLPYYSYSIAYLYSILNLPYMIDDGIIIIVE
jgi:hypothetical protein